MKTKKDYFELKGTAKEGNLNKARIHHRVREFTYRGINCICYKWYSDIFKVTELETGLKIFEGSMALRGQKNVIEACKRYLDGKTEVEMLSCKQNMEKFIALTQNLQIKDM